MMQSFLSQLYVLHLPVIVFEKKPGYPVVYMNAKAKLLFHPSFSVEQLTQGETSYMLQDMLQFENQEEFAAFCRVKRNTGVVEDYRANIYTFDKQILPVSISGVDMVLEDGSNCFIIYLTTFCDLTTTDAASYSNRLSTIMNAAFLTDDVESAIQNTIALAGQYVDASRVYIFEEINKTTTRNTYEWCAPGIEPAIQDLQNLMKADYHYDTIVNSGMYIVNDVQKLPQQDREILEMQGIKALAILPFYSQKKPIGYMGFDDCNTVRVWSHDQIQFLETIAVMVANFIKRRNAEQEAHNSQNILQTISDNSDNMVYVNSLEDYIIKFVSKSVENAFGMSADEMVGKRCWQVLQKDQTGPCSFCPIPHIQHPDGEDKSDVYVWEIQNTRTQKTYLAKDYIIKWVDGQYVHVETAMDISSRKEYENTLQYYAYMDQMTGTYNRQWGYAALEKELKKTDIFGSLCFIDVDGLKRTNDQFGHTAGDSLLMDITKTIKKYLEQGEYICRWGGDEFILWLKRNQQDAKEMIIQIQKEMDCINKENTQNYQLSFSYGIIAVTQSMDCDLDTIVMQADERMYKNKVEKRSMNKRRRRDD